MQHVFIPSRAWRVSMSHQHSDSLWHVNIVGQNITILQSYVKGRNSKFCIQKAAQHFTLVAKGLKDRLNFDKEWKYSFKYFHICILVNSDSLFVFLYLPHMGSPVQQEHQSSPRLSIYLSFQGNQGIFNLGHTCDGQEKCCLYFWMELHMDSRESSKCAWRYRGCIALSLYPQAHES